MKNVMAISRFLVLAFIVLTLVLSAAIPVMAAKPNEKEQPKVGQTEVVSKSVTKKLIKSETKNGKTVNTWQATISSLPEYQDDLKTKIDPSWHENKKTFTAGANLFSATVKGERVEVVKDGQSMIWSPEITAGKGKAKATSNDPVIVKDFYNPNYPANTLMWDYGKFKRYVRVIEGLIQELYVFESNPGESITIDDKSEKTASFDYERPVIVFDADGKLLDFKDGTITADEFNRPDIVYPIIIDPDVTFATSASDGYVERQGEVYNTQWAETAGNIKTDVAVYSYVGQRYDSVTTLYSIDRGFLYFDTSDIGIDIVIAGTLRFYMYSDYSTTDFDVVIQSGQPTFPSDPIAYGDYNKANYSGSGGTINTSGLIMGYNDITLNSTGISWVNRTGVTKLCLRSSRDIAGTTPTGNEHIRIRTYEMGINYQPKLVLTYLEITAPAITAMAATNVSFTSAKLNSNITDGGNDPDCEVRFGYGTVSHTAGDFESYTTKTAWVDGYETGDSPYVQVTGLSKDTVYYFRAQIKNLDNTTTSTNELYFDTTAQPSILEDYTLITPGSVLTDNPMMPPQMYTELDTSKIPGGAIVDDILAESDTPPSLFWFPFIFVGIGIFAMLIYGLTVKTGGEGSLLLMCITIEAGLVLFGIMGATGTSSIIPLFPMFLFPIPAIALIMSKKQYGWG